MLAQWAHLRSPLAALTYLCVLAPPSLALAMLAFSSAMLSSASFGLTAVEVAAAQCLNNCAGYQNSSAKAHADCTLLTKDTDFSWR